MAAPQFLVRRWREAYASSVNFVATVTYDHNNSCKPCTDRQSLMFSFQNAPIILLREGTDVSQGRAQIVSNINACQAVVDIVKSTLGPRGMDKLIHDKNKNVTITNDGATVMDLLNVVHPAAKVLVDIAKAQDDEVGDGTTSVVILAGRSSVVHFLPRLPLLSLCMQSDGCRRVLVGGKKLY